MLLRPLTLRPQIMKSDVQKCNKWLSVCQQRVNASLQLRYFRQTYAVKTTRDIRFFTAFQGHDRNFHRITGTYIRGRETINRR